MSAPLKLSTRHIVKLGEFMEGLNLLTRSTGVQVFGPGCNASVVVGDNAIEIAWDEEGREYAIDDRIGS